MDMIVIPQNPDLLSTMAYCEFASYNAISEEQLLENILGGEHKVAILVDRLTDLPYLAKSDKVNKYARRDTTKDVRIIGFQRNKNMIRLIEKRVADHINFDSAVLHVIAEPTMEQLAKVSFCIKFTMSRFTQNVWKLKTDHYTILQVFKH